MHNEHETPNNLMHLVAGKSWQPHYTQGTAHEQQPNTTEYSLRIKQSHAHWSTLTIQHGITVADVQCSRKSSNVKHAQEQPMDYMVLEAAKTQREQRVTPPSISELRTQDLGDTG